MRKIESERIFLEIFCTQSPLKWSLFHEIVTKEGLQEDPKYNFALLKDIFLVQVKQSRLYMYTGYICLQLDGCNNQKYKIQNDCVERNLSSDLID